MRRASSKNLLADKIADAMRPFLPPLGIAPEQNGIIEQWSNTMCDALDAHFAQHLASARLPARVLATMA